MPIPIPFLIACPHREFYLIQISQIQKEVPPYHKIHRLILFHFHLSLLQLDGPKIVLAPVPSYHNAHYAKIGSPRKRLFPFPLRHGRQTPIGVDGFGAWGHHKTAKYRYHPKALYVW